MANEATLVFRKSDKGIQRTVADGTGIEKGTILKNTDNNVAIASSGSGDVFGGILLREKIASDGRTSVAAAMDGTWKMTDAGAGITAGQWVSTSGANLIKTATEAEIAAGKGIGRAREDIAGAGTGLVEVGAQ
jgi:hypothetical protein